jgi:hypothetical protein
MSFSSLTVVCCAAIKLSGVGGNVPGLPGEVAAERGETLFSFFGILTTGELY